MGATSVRKESSVLDAARITRVRVRRAWRDAALTSLLGVLLIPYFLGCCAIRERYNRLDVPVGAYEPEQPNPLFVQTDDPEALWDAIVDVIDNYFELTSEPTRTVRDTTIAPKDASIPNPLLWAAFKSPGGETVPNAAIDGSRPFRPFDPTPMCALPRKRRGSLST